MKPVPPRIKIFFGFGGAAACGVVEDCEEADEPHEACSTPNAAAARPVRRRSRRVVDIARTISRRFSAWNATRATPGVPLLAAEYRARFVLDLAQLLLGLGHRRHRRLLRPLVAHDLDRGHDLRDLVVDLIELDHEVRELGIMRSSGLHRRRCGREPLAGLCYLTVARDDDRLEARGGRGRSDPRYLEVDRDRALQRGRILRCLDRDERIPGLLAALAD